MQAMIVAMQASVQASLQGSQASMKAEIQQQVAAIATQFGPASTLKAVQVYTHHTVYIPGTPEPRTANDKKVILQTGLICSLDPAVSHDVIRDG